MALRNRRPARALPPVSLADRAPSVADAYKGLDRAHRSPTTRYRCCADRQCDDQRWVQDTDEGVPTSASSSTDRRPESRLSRPPCLGRSPNPFLRGSNTDVKCATCCRMSNSKRSSLISGCMALPWRCRRGHTRPRSIVPRRGRPPASMNPEGLASRRSARFAARTDSEQEPTKALRPSAVPTGRVARIQR